MSINVFPIQTFFKFKQTGVTTTPNVTFRVMKLARYVTVDDGAN